MTRQNDLPDGYNRAIIEQPVSSHGLASRSQFNRELKSGRKSGPKLVDFLNHDYYSTTRTVGQTPLVVAGTNELRRSLILQNNGAIDVYLGFGVEPDLSNGINSFILPANGYLGFENGFCPNNVVYGVCSATALVCVIEGVIK